MQSGSSGAPADGKFSALHMFTWAYHHGACGCRKCVQTYCLCRIPIGIKLGRLPVVKLGHKCTKQECKHARGIFTWWLSELAKEKRKAHHCKTLAFLIYMFNLYLDWKEKSLYVFPSVGHKFQTVLLGGPLFVTGDKELDRRCKSLPFRGSSFGPNLNAEKLFSL